MSNYHKSFCIERGILFVLVTVLCLSFILAEGSWDSFDEGNGSSVVLMENLSDNSVRIEADESESFGSSNLEDSSFEDGDSFEYTLYFYLALGVGIVGLLVAVLFIYLFLKRPKNRWKK